jgi:CRP-like cAMP-binding protein
MPLPKLEQYLRQHIPGLSAAELSCICAAATTKKLLKKELLLREGEVCRYKSFVESGLMRNYYMAEDGNEYIMKFTPELNWVVDSDSFNNGTPSRLYIEALEPTTLFMWSKATFEHLRGTIPALNTFSERVINTTVSDIQKRVLLNISARAEERYRDFMQSYPNLLQRVPLHMIASYLGVSRETLTRVRQGMAISLKG